MFFSVEVFYTLMWSSALQNFNIKIQVAPLEYRIRIASMLLLFFYHTLQVMDSLVGVFSYLTCLLIYLQPWALYLTFDRISPGAPVDFISIHISIKSSY